SSSNSSLCFFFQAEDCIRDRNVTGVQTCALPIYPYFPLSPQTRIQAQASGYWLEREQWLAGEFYEQLPQALDFNQFAPLPHQWRSEERRVGKEGKAQL